MGLREDEWEFRRTQVLAADVTHLRVRRGYDEPATGPRSLFHGANRKSSHFTVVMFVTPEKAAAAVARVFKS